MSELASRPWPTRRLKYAVSLRRVRGEGDGDERPFVGLEQIESGTGRLIGGDVSVLLTRDNSSGREDLTPRFPALLALVG